jgi:hypothetical protein
LFRFESRETNVTDSIFIFRLCLPETPNARKSLEVFEIRRRSVAGMHKAVRSVVAVVARRLRRQRAGRPASSRSTACSGSGCTNINIAVCSSDNAESGSLQNSL